MQAADFYVSSKLIRMREEHMNAKTIKKVIAITCTTGIVKYIAAGIILAKLIDIGHKSKPKAKGR